MNNTNTIINSDMFIRNINLNLISNIELDEPYKGIWSFYKHIFPDYIISHPNTQVYKYISTFNKKLFMYNYGHKHNYIYISNALYLKVYQYFIEKNLNFKYDEFALSTFVCYLKYLIPHLHVSNDCKVYIGY